MRFSSRLVRTMVVACFAAVTLPGQTEGVGAAPEVPAAEMRFSNTASWDEGARAWLAKGPVLLGDWREFIVIPPPPGNLSREVELELVELHKLEDERDGPAYMQIGVERTLEGFSLGGFSYRTIGGKLPEAKSLLDLGLAEISPMVFALKKEHDRVRPGVLDPTLSPCIEAPGHPSYPSGHAAQAYLMAYLLADIDPANVAGYFDSASEIAVRREEAGVHFGSDTDAGRELARQVYNRLKEVPAYKERLAGARSEFGEKMGVAQAPELAGKTSPGGGGEQAGGTFKRPDRGETEGAATPAPGEVPKAEKAGFFRRLFDRLRGK